MFQRPLIRLSFAALLCAAWFASPAAAARETSLGLETFSVETNETLAMFRLSYHAWPERGPGFAAGLSTCGFFSSADFAVTMPIVGRNARVVPRLGASVLGVGMYGATAGVTGGVQLAAGRPGASGVALDVATTVYPELDAPVTRVGISYLWGGD